MSVHPHRIALRSARELESEPRGEHAAAEDWLALWVLDHELAQPFPLRGAAGVAALCAVSLALWLALIWALLGTVS